MKKILLSALFVTVSFLFTGCHEIDHPISGHTYGHSISSYTSSVSTYYTFYSNGNFEAFYVNEKNGVKSENSYPHQKWSASGNRITVVHDNSTYWKKDARGTVSNEFIYDSANDCISDADGLSTYYRCNKPK